MIKFFRHIRKQVLGDGKAGKPASQTGRYFKYAIGEIILVMIGILLALQVNNWNENRKKEIIEIQFLKTLVADLESDTIYLNRRIIDSENEIRNYYLYVKRSYEEQKSIDDFRKLVSLVNYNSEHFVFQNSTYLELINAGQMNIFKNKQLKNSINTLYKNYNIKEAHIREFNEYSSDYLKRAELTHFKYYDFIDNSFENEIPEFYDKSEWSYINDRQSYKFKILEEIALLYSEKHNIFRDYFVELKEHTTQLIIDINAELDLRN